MIVTNEELQLEFSNRDLRTKALPTTTMSPVRRNNSGSTPSGTMLSGREIMEFESHIRDLKIEIYKANKTISDIQIELDMSKEEVEDLNAKYFACQRERDLLKIKSERLEQKLKDNNLWTEEDNEKDQEGEQENDELKLVEEYHEKIEEYKRLADDKEKFIRHLKAENEVLHKKTEEESSLLSEKALLCEKYKRDLSNLEKEHLKLQKRLKMSPAEKHAERMEAARMGKTGYATQKEQRRENLKTIIKHGRQIKKHQEWMSKELGNTIENFNEMFINNLSQSLTQIFVDKDKKLEAEHDHDLEEEDEEEEEEGDALFEVEVVGQQVQDLEKSKKVDHDEDIDHSGIPLHTGDDESVKPEEGEEEEKELTPESQDQIIEQNLEAKAKSKEMQDHLYEQEKTVIKIEGSLMEREKLLKAVKESHTLMQNSLLEEMKKEYYKKVKEMEYEIQKLKSDHKLSIRGATSQGDKTKVEEQYKHKMSDLEQKLVHYKSKEKQQKKMEKEVVKQSNKIRVLENDIEKIRNQKVTLNRKLKEYDEKYKKWKLDKSNELVKVKKSSVAKDREINKLKREKRKNEILAQRKTAELNLLKKRTKDDEMARKKEAVRRRKAVKGPNVAKIRKSKQGGAKEVSTTHKKPEPSQPVDIEKIRNWIEANVEKMVTIKHLQKELDEFETKKQQVEDEINEEQKYYSEISIKKEKCIMRKGKLQLQADEGEALTIEKDIEEYDAILNQNQENIESLEDKIGYYNKEIINLEQAIEEVNNEEIKGLNLSEVNSVQTAQILLIAFFNVILEVKIQRVELEETVIEQHSSIQEIEKELKVLRESKRTTELEFNRALQKREKEYRELESKLLQEAEERVGESKIVDPNQKGLTVLEAKRLEKKKNDQHYSVGAYEDSKRKLSKMMSQLERKLVLEEKKNVTMVNLLEQSKAEKEQYKQRYDNLRKKVKQDECDQLRMGKLASVDNALYNQNQLESNNQQNNKLTDYRDMRKERKIFKKGYNEGPANNPNTDNLSSFLSPETSGTGKDRRGAMNKMRGAMSLEQSNTNVFDRLLSHSTITSRIKEKPKMEQNDESSSGTSQYGQKQGPGGISDELSNIEESQLLWNCDFSVENAHNGPIYSIATMENQLYTCSKKSLKIWDIDTMDCISDIASHQGVIKSL